MSRSLKTLGLRLPDGTQRDIQESLTAARAQMPVLAALQAQAEAQARPVKRIATDDAEDWRAQVFGADVALTPRNVMIETRPGQELSGVGIVAPLTRLQSGRRGLQLTHFGRVYLARRVEPPPTVSRSRSGE